MNPLMKLIFDQLQRLTERLGLRGNRTAIGLVGALGLLVYAASVGDYAQGAAALSLLFAILGLRPQDPPIEPPLPTT